MKDRPLPHLAINPHLTTVGLDDLVGYRETKTGSYEAAGGTCLKALKTLKDLRQEVLGYSLSLIADADFDCPPRQAGPHGHQATRRRVLDRIGDEVGEDLHDVTVGIDKGQAGLGGG